VVAAAPADCLVTCGCCWRCRCSDRSCSSRLRAASTSCTSAALMMPVRCKALSSSCSSAAPSSPCNQATGVEGGACGYWGAASIPTSLDCMCCAHFGTTAALDVTHHCESHRCCCPCNTSQHCGKLPALAQEPHLQCCGRWRREHERRQPERHVRCRPLLQVATGRLGSQ
jgi:hypothetical protein